MNYTLLILLSAITCIAAFVWNQPKAAELLSLKLKARSAALTASRETYKSVYQKILKDQEDKKGKEIQK